MRKAQKLYFTGLRELEVRSETLPALLRGEVLVQARYSAISAGTELLVYRDQWPKDLALDQTIESLAGNFAYPLQYGYCSVGEVIELGQGVHPDWLGRQVFSFQPHSSHFLAPVESLIPIPEDILPQDAVFLPNMETAVNFIQDAAPRLGERAAVIGQGIVGLLTTAMLARFPLGALVTFENFTSRRQVSRELGAFASVDTTSEDPVEQAAGFFPNGSDLTIELSGTPEGLNLAIALTGFSGRVLIGSWYGSKPSMVDLGGRFHRERMHFISSQVSTIAPELSGRWTKERRMQTAWQMIREIAPARFISHSFKIEDAAEAYQQLDSNPGELLQVVFRYGD